MARTDHSVDIASLRDGHHPDERIELAYQVAADLLEVHDAAGISLDNWPHPRALVETLIGHPIQENGV